jgi:hypothetical protein
MDEGTRSSYTAERTTAAGLSAYEVARYGSCTANQLGGCLFSAGPATSGLDAWSVRGRGE